MSINQQISHKYSNALYVFHHDIQWTSFKEQMSASDHQKRSTEVAGMMCMRLYLNKSHDMGI